MLAMKQNKAAQVFEVRCQLHVAWFCNRQPEIQIMGSGSYYIT